MSVRAIKRRLFLSGLSGASLAAGGLLRNSAHAATEDDIPTFGHGMKMQDTLQDVPLTPFLDATGKETTLAAWHGKPYLLHLWATWCGPCIRELPEVNTTIRRLGREAPAIVAINTTGGDVARTGAFLQSHGATSLPVLADPDGVLLKALGPLPGMGEGKKGIPRTYIVDGEGHIRAWSVGMMRWAPADVMSRFDAIVSGR